MPGYWTLTWGCPRRPRVIEPVRHVGMHLVSFIWQSAIDNDLVTIRLKRDRASKAFCCQIMAKHLSTYRATTKRRFDEYLSIKTSSLTARHEWLRREWYRVYTMVGIKFDPALQCLTTTITISWCMYEAF
ncbi:hypothetical protein PM082_017870 [Marasmius tenuissimus]|nr:hypothetical protein PM082_017870 [Marasmius tenuissimus]